jgi:23S rRNA pseudouridine2605 synthase
MFEYIGCEVVTLKRIAIGELTLKGLRLGKSRKLTPDEIVYVKKLAGI